MLVAKTMLHLHETKRSNVLYNIAKAVVNCLLINLILAFQLVGCQWDILNIWQDSLHLMK